jgi:hypothetical protein
MLRRYRRDTYWSVDFLESKERSEVMTEATSAEAQEIRSGRVSRVRISIKNPLPADLEIHTVLPESLERFEQAFARGDREELKALLAAVDRLSELGHSRRYPNDSEGCVRASERERLTALTSERRDAAP